MTSDPLWPENRSVTVIADPPGWFTPFARDLSARLLAAGLETQAVDRQEDVAPGTIAFYLSCTGITPPERLALNTWNLVVHASALPQGRGFSPFVWQILEGKNTVPLTMITMTDEVDAGDIVMQRHLTFAGHELNDEMRDAIGRAIVEMCFEIATSPHPPTLQPQKGVPSWYDRRRAEDSRLDPRKSIEAQFNLLRVVDNTAYPAFFDLHGHRYWLRIIREPNEGL